MDFFIGSALSRRGSRFAREACAAVVHLRRISGERYRVSTAFTSPGKQGRQLQILDPGPTGTNTAENADPGT